MDDSSSRDSDSPTMRKVPEKPPFKLCFSKDQILAGDSIPPKFYSKQCEIGDANDPNESHALEKIRAAERKLATDVANCYRCRLLSSHAYGWWHEQGIQPKHSRFNFHKKTSDLVHFQMKVYAEDRRLDVPKH